jgi:hypothetical protein
MSRRFLTFGAVAIGVIVAGGVAVAALISSQVPLQEPTANSPAPTLACSPAPCASLQGYTIWISGLAVNRDVVSMQIVFKNSSNSTHASPEHVQLIDAKQHASGVITDAPGCTTWNRHEFHSGAQFAPGTICFRISSSSPPLVLRWTPDFGLFCCQADIKLD